MDSILIKHILDDSKITINFDLLNGSPSFPPIELKIDGDIDLNSLVVKLTELIEEKRTLTLEYVDANSLMVTNPKMQLVKVTLDEIYSVFDKLEHSDGQNQVEPDSDVPF